MALIKCPECGKEISDKAPACIHCGYPLRELKSESTPVSPAAQIEPQPVSTMKQVVIASKSNSVTNKLSVIRVVREITGMDLADAKNLVEQDAPYVVVKDNLTQTQAENIVKKFEEIGETAEILSSGVKVMKYQNSTLTIDNHNTNSIANNTASAPIANTVKDKDEIRCPWCGSTQYSAGARGYSLLWGFIGSGKTVLTCLKCGHRWKPGSSW